MSRILPQLFWLCWRSTRNSMLFFTILYTALGYFVLSLSRRPELAAQTVFMMIFIFSCISTMAVISVNQKEGFPLQFEFRLPVSSTLLTGSCMLFISLFCAAVFFIPLSLLRLRFGMPFPLLYGTLLIMLMVILLLHSSWSTSSRGQRAINLAVVLVFYPILVGLMNPFKPKSSLDPGTTAIPADMIFLTTSQTALLLVLAILLIAETVYFVHRQRTGETGLFGSGAMSGSWRLALSKPLHFFDLLRMPFRVPCPITAGWKAEVWVECQRYGFPLLLLSMLLALLVPVFNLARVHWGWTLPGEMLLPDVVFLTGIGLSLFNRRMAKDGYMDAFERARPLGTVTMMGIQIMTTALSSLLGILLILGACWLAMPMLEGSDAGIRFQQQVSDFAALTVFDQLLLFSSAVVLYITLIQALYCLHSGSVFWKRWFSYSILLLVLYWSLVMLSMIFRQTMSPSDLQVFNWHIYSAVVLLLLILPLALYHCLTRQILSAGTVLAAFALWLLFMAGANHSLMVLGKDLTQMPPPLQALTLSALSLPLSLFFTGAWFHDRLRHTD